MGKFPLTGHTFSAARIAAMAASLKDLIGLPDAIGAEKVWTRPSGIEIHEKRVPLGVVAIIYEARPNVTADAAALCIKSGNAVVLRGGKGRIRHFLSTIHLIRMEN